MRGKSRDRGSLVLVALCFTAVIGIALAGYITLCYRSQDFSTREYNNKRARYLAETGMEEALWALNNATWTTSGPSSTSSWSGTTTKTLTITGYSLGLGATGQVALTVTNATGNTPSISSVATVTLANGKTFVKTLSATTQRASAFPNAIASSSGTVSFTSDGTVDSFNSSVAAYATPSSSAGFAAVVAGNNVSLNNADVKGYVETDGNAPTYTASATIKSYTSPASPNIDPSRVGMSGFVPFFAVTTPNPGTWTGTLTNNSTQTIGTIGATTPAYWRFAGNYSLSSATLTVQGPVKIVITGNLSLTGTGRIRVNNTSNAAVEIFVGGSVTVSSSNAFNNRSPSTAAPVPDNLALYITGSGSTLTWNTTVRYDGVIYATHASSGTLSITNNGAIFYGALLSNNAITFSGSAPQIHYDSALRTATFEAITTPFVISVLSEVATER